MKYHIAFDIDFRRNPYKGRYIALEGIDGSGKTRQVDELIAYFQKQKKEIVVTHEPRKKDSIFSELIHKILLGEVKVLPIAMQYLMSADRVQNHLETVIPALQQGKTVISHRVFWSIVPYSISDLDPKYYKNSADFLLVANNVLSMYHQFIVPDYTFYLDVPVDTAMQWLSKRKNKQKEVYEKKEKLKKHVLGYQWLLKTFPQEFIIINGAQPVENVTQEIISKLPR